MDPELAMFDKLLRELDTCGNSLATRMARRGKTGPAMALSQKLLELRLTYEAVADSISVILAAKGQTTAVTPDTITNEALTRAVKASKKARIEAEGGATFE